MSASDDPIDPLVEYDVLMPLKAMPTLSRIDCNSPAGITERTVRSTRSLNADVSSTRVPVGARMCKRICPESTVGKRSRPSHGTITMLDAQNPRNAVPKTKRCRKHHIKESRYWL